MNVEIFCARCPDLAAARDAGAALLAPARRTKMERYARGEDQLRCLGAGLLLRQVLGVTDDAHLRYGSLGKPLSARRPAPGFSLAHAGDYAVLAVGPPALGTDIEPRSAARFLADDVQGHNGPREYDDLFMTSCMTFEERRQWAAAPRRDEVFLRIWTGKESLMKATGRGMSLDPATFSVLPLTDGPRFWRGRQWFLAWREMEAHQMAVASPFPFSRVQITLLSTAELLR